MESDTRKICRFCLKTCNDNFESIKEIHQENLNSISLHLNLTITYQPIVCSNCEETLQKCYDFKMACLQVENTVVSFAERQDCNEVDLRKYCQETLPEGCNICRFCLKITEAEFFTFFNEEKPDILLVNAMLQQYFPETDLNATKEPVICMQCYESLQHYFNFVINCLNVENKINKYCETEGTSFEGLVKLSKVVYFTLDDTSENKDEASNLDMIKIRGSWCDKAEIKTEGMGCEENDNSKKFEVKDEKITEEGEGNHEGVKRCEDVEVKYENIVKEEIPAEREIIYIDANIKNEVIADAEETYWEGLEHINVNSYIKYEDNQTNTPKFSPNCNKAEKMEDTSFCESNDPLRLKEDPQEEMHYSSEGQTFKCAVCLYQTKHKCCFKNHLLTHQETSEIKKYKCEMCVYQNKNKQCVDLHMLVHTNGLELTQYKCELCSYQTVRSDNYQRHMLTHELSNSITHTSEAGSNQSASHHKSTLRYKCDMCNYQFKYKNSLLRHILQHKSSSEVKMYKCSLCPYQSRHKDALRKHALVHKSVAEVKMFQCAICECQFKRKVYLKRHLLVHKNTSEVPVYKCEHCPYQSKHKNDLKQHVLIHKKFSEVKVYKCEICNYQSKRKCNLQRHVLNNRCVSKVTMLNCEVCPYQTRHTVKLQTHMLTHGKIKPFKCEICRSQCKSKAGLQRHKSKNHKKSRNVQGRVLCEPA